MSKPPSGKKTWEAYPGNVAPGDFVDIRFTTQAADTLDEAIRAVDQGDGAMIQELQDEILGFLRELKNWRESVGTKPDRTEADRHGTR